MTDGAQNTSCSGLSGASGLFNPSLVAERDIV